MHVGASAATPVRDDRRRIGRRSRGLAGVPGDARTLIANVGGCGRRRAGRGGAARGGAGRRRTRPGSGRTGHRHGQAAFELEDVLDALGIERFEVQPGGCIKVGGYGLWIGVDHDRAPTLAPEHVGGLDGAVVELDSLPDPYGTAADDECPGSRHGRCLRRGSCGGIGRVEVRGLGGELGGTGIDHRVAGREPERQPRGADIRFADPSQPRKVMIRERRALGGRQQCRRFGVRGIGEPRAHGLHVVLQHDVASHLGEEPWRDPGRRTDHLLRHAPAQQPEDPPQSRVGRLEELPEHDRCRGPLREPGALARLATLAGPADDGVLLDVERIGGRGDGGGARARVAAGVDRGQVIEARLPGRILAERPGTRLLQAPERLVERGAERPVDRHDLAGRLHLRPEPPVGCRELVEREARQLDHHVVERRLERRHGRPGHHVWDVGERAPGRDLCRNPRDRIAGRLGRERARPRHPGIHLDHRVLGRIGRERELDVTAALDAQRPDDRECRAAQPLVDGIGQRLDRSNHDGVAGVNAQGIDVLHRAHGDARVVGVAHHLVFDLLPPDQALLDHDLVDGAGPKAGSHPFAVGRLGPDDPAARAAQRERRADDRRQPDLGECRIRRHEAGCLVGPFHDRRRRVRLADPVEQVTERLAVLGHPDRLERRPKQADPVALEHTRLGQRHRQVEGGLPAQAGQQPLRPLARDDRLDRVDRQRLEVDNVGDGRVGHDRGRVGVDEDGPDALGAQRPTRLRPGIVELGRLADDDRSRSQDQDGRRPKAPGTDRHRPPGTVSRHRARPGPGTPRSWTPCPMERVPLVARVPQVL